MYNKGMNDKYNTPNSSCCGRPMYYAPKPKCDYNNCCFNEYNHKMLACIKKKQPDCMAKAVIPSITVDTVDGLTNLANCFVHVSSINTTFYVDDKHRPMIIWAGPVEVDLPSDISTQEEFEEFIRSFKLKSQFLYVKIFDAESNNYNFDSFYFDKTGKIYFAGEFYPVDGGLI